LSLKPKGKKSKTGGGKGGFGGGFGGGGGGGGGETGGRADPSKVRTVSGHTGSGAKVLAAAANNFDDIRKVYGKESTLDLYVLSPLNDPTTYWFVGKANCRSDPADASLVGIPPSKTDAVLSQKRLILEYAKNKLRPQNMGGPYSSALEIWTAPGDTEMDVVRNVVDLSKVEGSTKNLPEGFNVKDVGFNPELYIGDEQEKGGLRVVRDSEGKSIKPVFDVGV